MPYYRSNSHVRRVAFGAAVLVSAVAVATALTASTAAAQDADLLVSVEWLADNVGNDDLVLLHLGPEDEYAAEHIPGAVLVTMRGISHPDSHSEGNLILELPEAATLEASLREWGVSDRSHVVVYWGGEWVTPAARTVFTLDWAGLGNRTSLLDGGFTAWKAGGHVVTTEVVQPTPGDVTIHPRSDLIVEADWVQKNGNRDGFQMVDARAPAFFDGVQEDRGALGHIPGAGNVHWTTLISEETLLLQTREHLAGLLAAAGVEPGDTVVGYCHIGQYATLMLFTARLLGHEVVLYDGAFQDWAARELPTETGT